MRLSNLSAESRRRIGLLRYDRIVEKHEGPWEWSTILEDCDFIKAGGRDVLLPVFAEHHQNITSLRCDFSADGRSVTLFLKDTTHTRGPEEEFFGAGFVAVCDKFEGEDFFVAVLYHEWFMVETTRLD